LARAPEEFHTTWGPILQKVTMMARLYTRAHWQINKHYLVDIMGFGC